MARSTAYAGMSRRHFLAGSGALAATGALAAAGTALADEAPAGIAFADTVKWDAEYDVVVVGWGAAGSVAAVSAAEAGAKVLLTEKAPFGDEGGNTRFCEQYMCVPRSYEDGVSFYQAMFQYYGTATDEVIDYMATGSTSIGDWLLAHGAETFSDGHAATNAAKAEAEARGEQVEESANGTPTDEIMDWAYLDSAGNIQMSEYAVLPDGTPMDGRVCEFTQVDAPDNSEKKLWRLLRKNVVERKDAIDVWYESPAVRLIQDPFSKTVLGVTISRKGTEVNVRANSGVVLTCGSFEANMEMMANYTQHPFAYTMGSTYNTGDGVKMALDVNADLWHMNATSGPWIRPKYHNADRCILSENIAGQRLTTLGSCINVGSDGKRFMKESGSNKHGHVNIGGTWMSQPTPDVMYAVFDEAARNGGGTIAVVEDEEIVAADTIEALAEALSIDPEALRATVDEWNGFVAAGKDERFLRDESSLAAIAEEGPYYAVRIYPAYVNCQGGPKRNTSCEVLDTDGGPIPNLYSAGELGSFWAGVYICGGNICEAIYTGITAGTNAARPKDAPAPVTLEVVESAPASLGNDLDESEAGVQVALGEGEYVGTGQGMHGDIVVKVAVADGRPTSIEVVQQTETADITARVWDELPAAMVEAGTADVDAIAGATLASNGLIAAVKDALAQA